VRAHTAAGKLQGLKDDALWYEAALVVGVTNALNVVADALDGTTSEWLTPIDEAADGVDARDLFAEVRTFYDAASVPLPFRVMARDPAYATDVWRAVKRAFSDNRLDRRLKEARPGERPGWNVLGRRVDRIWRAGRHAVFRRQGLR